MDHRAVAKKIRVPLIGRAASGVGRVMLCALVVGACQAGTPAEPTATPRPTPRAASTTTPTGSAHPDPVSLVRDTLEAAHRLDSVRIEMTLTGFIQGDLLGRGPDGAIELDGVFVTADVDLREPAARIFIEAPPLLGMTGEEITIGSDSWRRTSIGGSTWTHDTSTLLPGGGGTPWDKVLSDIESWLRTDFMAPEWLGTVECGSDRCDRVRVPIAPALLGHMLHDPPRDAAVEIAVRQTDSLPVSVLVEFHQAQTPDDPRELTFRLDASLSRFDEPVRITPPDPSEVVEAPPPPPTPAPPSVRCRPLRDGIERIVPLQLTRVWDSGPGCVYLFAEQRPGEPPPYGPSVLVRPEPSTALVEARSWISGRDVPGLGDDAYLHSGDVLLVSRGDETWGAYLMEFPREMDRDAILIAVMRLLLRTT